MKLFFSLLFLTTCLGSPAKSQAEPKEMWIYTFPDPLFKEEDLFEAMSLETVVKKSDDELIVEKSKNLEERLGLHIFGQPRAVKETANAIVRYAAGINDPNNVIASLLYCGPSGVGKTELAKQLCMELYGNPQRLIRINMSEYAESHTINRLIGSPPGYLGYEEGGQLTNAILQNPYSIVLLDEIEKAHPKILKLFLHVFDAGYFTSAKGQVVNCRKCVFILTSNLAALEIADLVANELDDEAVIEALKPLFMEVLSPELYNRLDPIIFGPLSDDVIEKLVNKVLADLDNRVYTSKKIHLVFDRTLVDYLSYHGFDPRLGARPLKRLVEKELATIIAKVILQGNCKREDRLKCSYQDGYIVVEKI